MIQKKKKQETRYTKSDMSNCGEIENKKNKSLPQSPVNLALIIHMPCLFALEEFIC